MQYKKTAEFTEEDSSDVSSPEQMLNHDQSSSSFFPTTVSSSSIAIKSTPRPLLPLVSECSNVAKTVPSTMPLSFSVCIERMKYFFHCLIYAHLQQEKCTFLILYLHIYETVDLEDLEILLYMTNVHDFRL